MALKLLPSTPPLSVDTRCVCPVCRFLTKMSKAPFISPATRLLAKLWKPTKRPSADRAGVALKLLPSTPPLSVDTRCVCPVSRSLTKMSRVLFISPGTGTRLLAKLWKATKRPSADRVGCWLGLLPPTPPLSVDTRSVCPVCRFLTKMSIVPLVSPATRLLAKLSKATKRPSAERAGLALKPLPSTPPLSVDTRCISPVCKSLTKMSKVLFVSPATRLLASLSKATKRPSAERTGWGLPPLPCTPSVRVEASSIVCVGALPSSRSAPVVPVRLWLKLLDKLPLTNCEPLANLKLTGTSSQLCTPSRVRVLPLSENVVPAPSTLAPISRDAAESAALSKNNKSCCGLKLMCWPLTNALKR